MSNFATYTFSGATAGTDLNAYAPVAGEVGGTWVRHASFSTNPAVFSAAKHARNNVAGALSVYYSPAVPPAADYTVEGDFFAAGGGYGSDIDGVILRCNTSSDTFYTLVWLLNSSWAIYKHGSTGSHNIGSGPIATPLVDGSTYTLKLSVSGSSLTGSVSTNGGAFAVVVGPITDTDTTAAGQAGVYLQNGAASDTEGLHLSGFRAYAGTAPTVTSGTASVSSVGNATASLVCGAASAGSGSYTYQWYMATTAGFTPGSGNLQAGQTALTFVPTGLTNGTAYHAKLVVTDTSTSATATSNEVSFTPAATPVVVSGTASVVSTGSGTASLACTAATSGSGTYTYQWYMATTAGFTPGSGNIQTGQTALTFVPTGLTNGTAYHAKLVVTDTSTSLTATSNEVSFTPVASVPHVVSGTASVVSTGSATASLACTAATSGSGSYTYQWYMATTAGFTPGSGNIQTGQTALTFVPTGLTNGTAYYAVCVVTDTSTTLNATSNQVTFTPAAVTGSPTILVNDANVFLSPYNFQVSGSAYAITPNTGAYVKLGFTGTSLSLLFDATVLPGGANNPEILYSIDDAPWVSAQLGASPQVLATGLVSGTHQAVIIFKSRVQTTLSWTTGGGCLKITGFGVDSGAASAAISPAAQPGNMLVYGDSITAGIYTISSASDLAGDDASLVYSRYLATAMGCELGNVGFGSQGWTTTGIGAVPVFHNPAAPGSSGWNQYFQNQSRLTGGLLTPAPTYIVCNHGTNDGLQNVADATVRSVVSSWLTAARAAAPTARIVVLIPFGGWKSAAITNGFTDYQTLVPDSLCKLVNLGSTATTGITGVAASLESSDGVHPLGNTHAKLAAMSAASIAAAFSGGTYTDPGVAHVQSGTAYTFNSVVKTGTYDPITGQYTDPGVANVATGITYTFAGVSKIGTLPSGGSSFSLSTAMGTPRALDALADSAVTVNDVLWGIYSTLVGQNDQSTPTIWTSKTPAGTLVRTRAVTLATPPINEVPVKTT